MSNILPPPEHPYRNWCDLIPALWEHGMAHASEEVMATFMHDFQLNFVDCFWASDSKDRAFARPSRGSQCPQMHYYANQPGFKMKPMPPSIAATFAMGHLAHAMAYGAIASVLPECFKLIAESSADVSNTIPEPGAQTGTIDLIIITTDHEEAFKYIHGPTLEEVPNILGDFKTMTGRGWRDHSKKVFDESFDDALGHTGQLATYRFSKTVMELEKEFGHIGTVLIGVNKESPHMGVVPRFIPHEYLLKRHEHAKLCYANTEDVGPWLLDTYGKGKVGYYCDAFGKGGYCPAAHDCRKNRMTTRVEKPEILDINAPEEKA